MSLLLDALNEAERRKGEPRPDPTSPRDLAQRAEVPAVKQDKGGDELPLSLAEEPEAAPPTANPQPAAASHKVATKQKGAVRQPESRAPQSVAMSAASTPANPRPRLIRVALLAIAVVAGVATCWMLFRQPAMTLPPLAASVTTTVPVVPETSTPPGAPAVPLLPIQPEALRKATPETREKPAVEEAASAPPRRATAPEIGTVPAPAPAPAPQVIFQGRPSPLPAAHAALRSGDLQRAEQLYRDTLAGEPDQPDAHLGLALIEQSRNSAAAALAHYRKVLNRRPTDAQAWAGIADLAGDMEQDAMESRLRDLIATRPDPALHFALGNLLARQSRWPDAQENYFAAVAGAPGNADYIFNLAVAIDRLGKGRAAIAQYSRALELAGDGHGVQFGIAAVRTRLQQLQAANP